VQVVKKLLMGSLLGFKNICGKTLDMRKLLLNESYMKIKQARSAVMRSPKAFNAVCP
jgi:hypothetical protein